MTNASLEFEVLVRKLFEALKYSVEADPRVTHLYRCDLIVSGSLGKRIPVEVRLIRRQIADLQMVRDVAARFGNFPETAELGRPLIILSSGFAESPKAWIESTYNVDVWTRSTLLKLADNAPEIRRKLEHFLQEHDASSKLVDKGVAKAPAFEGKPPVHEQPRGEQLCADLRKLPSGKADAKEYEALCQAIIDYLFGNYLLDAQPQRRSENGVSVLDLVYRVRAGNKFWDGLARDFKARTILFECKNYGLRIKPEQIYTTERYVLPAAGRGVCFLLSRKGGSERTELAAFGAMRETGKLIVCLSDADLCSMLKVKDAGGTSDSDDELGDDADPTVILDQKIYAFISKMGR